MVATENVVRTNGQTSVNRIRLDFPVPVDPRMPTKEAHEVAGINEWISSSVFSNVKPISEIPYVYQALYLYLGLSAEEAKSQFEPGEVGTVLFEVSALYRHKPDFIRSYGVGAGETGFEFNKTQYHPRLSRLGRDRAKLDVVDANYVSPRYGILTRRKEIYFPASTNPWLAT